MKTVVKNVISGLGQLAEETGKEAVKQGGKIAEGVAGGISGADWVSDIKPVADRDLDRKKREDEQKKRFEMAKFGRKLEEEMDVIRQEKKRKEEEEEKASLQQIEQKRAEEARERQALADMNTESSDPSKRKKSRGSALISGKKKPSNSDMSATSEFSKKPD